MANIKLTKDKFVEIKNRHNDGEALIEIARSLGVSYTTVRDIVRDRYRNGSFGQVGEFFDFGNRCVITGFLFPSDRDNRMRLG